MVRAGFVGAIHSSDFFQVDELPGKVVRVARLSRPFTSQADVDQACEPVQRALDRLGRSQHALLLDARRARGSNDPDHEAWFAAHRAKMLLGFRRVAILLRTVIGVMHSDRLTRTDGTRGAVEIFHDPVRAYGYVGASVADDEPPVDSAS